MVATSAADSEMTDAELMTIRQIVDGLPVFANFNADNSQNPRIVPKF